MGFAPELGVLPAMQRPQAESSPRTGVNPSAGAPVAVDPLLEFAREAPDALKGDGRAIQGKPSAAQPPQLSVSRSRVSFAWPGAVAFDRARSLSLFFLGSVCGGAMVFLVAQLMSSSPPDSSTQVSAQAPPPSLSASTLTESPILIREAKPEPSVSPASTPMPHQDPLGLLGTPRPPEARAAAPARRAPETRVSRPVPRVPVTVAPFVGSIVIASTPERARAFVNGQPVGLTPLVLSDLPVGSRAVRIEADDHASWSSTVRVVANQRTSVNAALAPLR